MSLASNIPRPHCHRLEHKKLCQYFQCWDSIISLPQCAILTMPPIRYNVGRVSFEDDYILKHSYSRFIFARLHVVVQ